MTDQPYQLPVFDTIKASWGKVYGSKGTFCLAFIVAFAIALGLGIIDGILEKSAPIIEYIFRFFLQIITYFIEMGLVYMGIRRAMDSPITFDMMFRVFNMILPFKIIGLYILQVLIMLIPIVIMFTSAALYPLFGTPIVSILFFIIGILATMYLGIRMMMSMGFVLDKEMGPVNAIKLSFRATDHNFWNLVGIIIIQTIILVCLGITVIGLIWALPFAFINYGMIYRSLSNTLTQ